MKLEDKVAVITGAGSGIGYEMATLFAREGARIMGADVDADGLATTAAAVEAIGRPMRTFVADVTDPTAVENLMAETVEPSAVSTSSATMPASGTWAACWTSPPKSGTG